MKIVIFIFSMQLFAMQGEVNIRIAMDVGVAGAVATSGVVQNIKDAYESPFFNAVWRKIEN